MASTDVLIAGGGPTGLALASELARFGVEFRIVDEARGASDLSKAIGVQPRTLETLDIMGVAGELLPLGNPAKSFHIYDDGKCILNLDFSRVASPYPHLLIVPQSDTERVLEESLQKRGGHVERNTRLTGFEQDEDGVTSTLASVDGGPQETIRSRWLVGCDGAHSAVRHGLGLPFEGKEYEDGFLLADVRIEWDQPHDALYLFLHDGWLCAAFGLPNGRYRIIADLPVSDAPLNLTPSLDDCKRIVDERCPFPLEMSEPTWMSHYRIHRRIVPKLSVGRVHLAGDAAHIHSPAAAQGMNTGIQDAFNLAWKLSLVAKGAAGEALLESYNAERYPVEHGVLTMTDTLLRMASIRQPLARRIRDAVAPVLSSTSFFQERMASRIAETDIDYHNSPIVVDRDHGHAPHAGLRAPDCEIDLPEGQSKRLYEILRDGQFVLLIFAGHGDPTGEKLSHVALDALGATPWPIQHYVVTSESPRSVFGITHAGLRLVRPDGAIGLRANAERAVDALKDWSERVFAGRRGDT